jgi:hypothetical protein
MAYIECKINGVKVEAIISSGCGISYISKELSRKVNLLEDGIAHGVLNSKEASIAKIHDAPISFNQIIIPTNLYVLEK